MSSAITTVSLNCHNEILSSTRELLSQTRPHTISLISIKPKTPLFSSTRSQKRHNFSVLYKLNNAESNHNTENSPRLQLDNKADDVGVKAALSMLKFYKREISPLLPKSCRYVPTCSEYSMEAYTKYGVVKGTVLTIWRICRCNPLGGSGFDPPRWFGEEAPSLEELEDDMV